MRRKRMSGESLFLRVFAAFVICVGGCSRVEGKEKSEVRDMLIVVILLRGFETESLPLPRLLVVVIESADVVVVVVVVSV